MGRDSAYRVLDPWIYSFHMPLFFLISGLFAERQVERSAGVFLRDKLATIIYPYVVWSWIQSLSQIALSRYTNRKPSLDELTWILVEPVQQFWFLYALFWISVIYYILRRSRLSPQWVLLIFAALRLSGNISLPLKLWVVIYFVKWFGIYVSLGSVFNGYGWTERVNRAPAWKLALTAAVGYFVVTASLYRASDVLGVAALSTSLCGIAATLALAVLLSRAPGLDFVRVLGVYSLEIYVAHVIASAGARIVLQKIFQVQDVATHLVIGTVCGIVFPLMLTWLCRRFHADFLFRLSLRRQA
jgi:fucose 4-O-acetylase-like acetyltransferase